MLNDNNGLPQNSVRTLFFDRQSGFLWMTTEAGLVRYDGARTHVFDLRELPPMKTVRMVRLFQTLAGITYVCNWEGEVFALGKNLPGEKLPQSLRTIDVFGERTGNVQSTKSLEIEDSLFNVSEPTPAIVQNSRWLNENEVIAVSLDKLKYFRRNKLIAEWKVSFAKQPLLFEKGGWIYAIENNGRHFCFQKENLRPISLDPPNFFTGSAQLFYDESTRQPLLLKDAKLYELQCDGPHIKLALFAALPQVPTDIKAIILHPNKKQLFIATHTTGVYIFKQSTFFVYEVANDNKLNNNYATCLIDSKRVVTCRSLQFDLQTGKAYPLPIELVHDRSLTLDRTGQLWSGMPGKIVHFPFTAPAQFSAIPLAPDNYLQTTYCNKNGTVWVSTARFLALAKNNQLLLQKIWGQAGDSLSFYYMAENKKGQLVGINKKGIYEFDSAAKTFSPLVLSPELRQVRFVSFDDDFCWITTYGNGFFLYHLPTKKLVKFPVDENGYLLYSHALIADSKNNFLVPTNKGLFRVSKENLLHIFRQPGTPLYYQYFDVSEGLLTNEFNGGCYPAFNRLPDGDILLPALLGLVRVKTANLPQAEAYPLWVDRIETKDSSYHLQNGFEFGEDERLQTWQLGLGQWSKANRQNIFYRLDGADAWQALPAGETKILLNELSGGKHRLQIRNQYGLQPSEFTLSEYRFSIAKRLLEQPVFWMASGALLSLLVYGYVRIRHAQLQQKNRRLQNIIRQNTKELSEKNIDLEETLQDLNEALKRLQEASVFKSRLIGLVGHDMLIPIRFIANIAGHLNQHVATLNPQTLTDSSAEIKSTAEQLLFLGENLIYWIKLQEGKFNLVQKTFNLHQLAVDICSVHKAVMAVKKNQLQCIVSDVTHCHYDPVLVQVILHNLLLNAHKFTANGDIKVEITLTASELHLAVADTGVGMEPEVVSSLNEMRPVDSVKGTGNEAGWGMGYLLIIDLLHLAQGTLHVESRVGEGTRVFIALPLSLD